MPGFTFHEPLLRGLLTTASRLRNCNIEIVTFRKTARIKCCLRIYHCRFHVEQRAEESGSVKFFGSWLWLWFEKGDQRTQQMSVHASPWMLKALRIASRNGQWHTTCNPSNPPFKCTTSTSIYLGPPSWLACALFRSK